MLILFLCLGALGFCWFLGRLAIQSSYYADPKKRFCGTLDRFFALVTTPLHRIKSGAPVDLSHYDGVKQFWFLEIPQSNLEADLHRFKGSRDEMARREALTAEKSDLRPVPRWQWVLGFLFLTALGFGAFFSSAV